MLLLDEPTRDLRRGWTLAAELGRPAAPLLWDLLAAERSNVDRRLALLVAALVAGGAAADERLMMLLDQQKPLLAERAMASLWISLGPTRPRPMPGVLQRLLGPNKEPEALLAVAARLAAARFPRSSQGVPALHSKDPGLLAAAAFAGMPVGRTSALRQWRGAPRHASLFRRAAMLGARRPEPAPTALLQRAAATVQSSDTRDRAERAAAALLLARFGELGRDEPPLGWELLKAVAGQPESGPALRARLRPGRFARDPSPGRLAAAYATYAELPAILASVDAWAGDPAVRRDLAVALAARLCAAPAPDVRIPALDFPEWSFVVWACEGRVGVAAPSDIEDERLAALLELLGAGRATRASVRDGLERALWRRGSHPGLGAWEQERALVRDVLLVGSRAGGKYRPEVPPHLRYFPTGLDRDDPFFDVAVALFEFTQRRSGPIPDDCRLR